MVDFRHALVRFKDERVGQIQEVPEGATLFAYDSGWTTPIGSSLPANPSVHPWLDGLHPFFQHLTAEGWLRERQARTDGLDQDDDLGLLLRYGRDCIGAVSIHAVEGDTSPSLPPDLEPVTRAALGSLRTLSGVQKKLLVVRKGGVYAPAGPDGAAPFIAKFNSDDMPTIVRNETLSLDLARLLLRRDEVVESMNADVDGLGRALVIKRIDRTADDRKLRLEDLCQVLVRPRGRRSEHKYDSSYEEAGNAIAAHSVRPEIDKSRFFNFVVVDALLGNCDAHLKNFSLLERPEGLRLAPAYDIVNTICYRGLGHSTRFALRIDGDHRQHDRIDRNLLLALARNLELDDRVIRSSFDDLSRRAPQVLSRLKQAAAAEHDTGFAGDYEQIVFSACHRILVDG